MVSVESLMRYAINYAMEQGADFVEVRYISKDREGIIMRNRDIDNLFNSYEYGFSLTVLVDGIYGLASTNIASRGYIERLVDEALSKARSGGGLSSFSIDEEAFEPADVNYFLEEKSPWDEYPIEDKIGILKSFDELIESNSFRCKFPGRVLVLERVLDTIIYMNSANVYICSRIPRVSMFYLVTAKFGSDTLQKFGEFGGSGGLETIWNDVVIEDFRALLAGMDRVLVDGVSSPTGRLDIVVDSEVAGIIAHEAVGHPFEADRIIGREFAQAGGSYLNRDSLGTKIGSDVVNVIDDPTIPGSFGFYYYDDEGVRGRRRVLIKEGVVNEFLHNRLTASIFNVDSNGAARAGGYDKEPIVRMGNTFFEPGDYSLEELIEDIARGLYIKSFMEWNIDDYRLNQRYTGLEAYAIDNGEITDPVKSPIIETNTYELLNSLDAVGDSLKFYPGRCGKGDPMQIVPVWMGGPPLRFRGIRVIKRD